MDPRLLQALKNRSQVEQKKNRGFLERMKSFGEGVGDVFTNGVKIYGALDQATGYHSPSSIF